MEYLIIKIQEYLYVSGRRLFDMLELELLILIFFGSIFIMFLLRYPKAIDKNYIGFIKSKISINIEKLNKIQKKGKE